MSGRKIVILMLAAVCLISASAFANSQGHQQTHSRAFPMSKTTCQDHRMTSAYGYQVFPPFIPRCNLDGSYSCVQTWPAVGLSWVVDEEGLPIQDSLTKGKAKCSKKKTFQAKYVCPKQRTLLFCGRKSALSLKRLIVGHKMIKQCKNCKPQMNVSTTGQEFNSTRCNKTKIVMKVRKRCEGKHRCFLAINTKLVSKECIREVKYIKINYICSPVKKGFCPRSKLPVNQDRNQSCATNCTADHECPEDFKCCRSGCGTSCVKPLSKPSNDWARNWRSNKTNNDNIGGDDDDNDYDDDDDDDDIGDEKSSNNGDDFGESGSGSGDGEEEDDDDDFSGDTDDDQGDNNAAADDDRRHHGQHGHHSHHRRHDHGHHNHRRQHGQHGHHSHHRGQHGQLCSNKPCKKYRNTSITIPSVCPKDKPMMKNCPIMLCKLVTCPGHENVTCRLNTCGSCRPEFFDSSGQQLDCVKARSPCHIHRFAHLVGAHLISRHQTPRCEKNGSFASTQCNYAINRQCWCVDEHGRERNHSRRHMRHGRPFCNETKPVLSECQVSRRESLTKLAAMQNLVRKTNASCHAYSASNSTFQTKWPSQNTTWREPLHNGSSSRTKMTRNQRLSSHIKSILEKHCLRRLKYLELVTKRILVPKCQRNGSFEPVQCVGEYCWCVNMKGFPRKNTKTKGKLPNCTSSSQPKSGFCPVLPSEASSMSLTSCESDGDCDGVMKCCNNGRGKHCMTPVQPACPKGQQFKMCVHGDSCLCAKCPANPKARCRMNYCNNCKPEFYDHNNTKVNCDCPAGQTAMSCPHDACHYSRCPANRNARCKTNPCNKCKAEFFDSNGKPVNCTLEKTICPNGRRAAPCHMFADQCQFATCAAHPQATCKINPCNMCRVEFVNDAGREVNCSAATTCQIMRARVMELEKKNSYKKKMSSATRGRNWGPTRSSGRMQAGQSQNFGQNLWQTLRNWMGRGGVGQGNQQSWSAGRQMFQSWQGRRGRNMGQRGQGSWSVGRQSPRNSQGGWAGQMGQAAGNQGSRSSSSFPRSSRSRNGFRRRGKRSIDLENEAFNVNDMVQKRFRRGLGSFTSRSMGSRPRQAGSMGSRSRQAGSMGSRSRQAGSMGSRSSSFNSSRSSTISRLSGFRGFSAQDNLRWKKPSKDNHNNISSTLAKRMPYGMFLPSCGSDGSFMEVQCKNTTDSDQKICWCVDGKGLLKNGTKKKLRISDSMTCGQEHGVSSTKKPEKPVKLEKQEKHVKPEKSLNSNNISSDGDSVSTKEQKKKPKRVQTIFQVVYHLAGSLKELIKMNKKEKLIKLVIRDAAKRFEVQESEIKNVRLEEGSILVAYDISRDSNEPEADAKIHEAAKKLEAEVKSRTFSLVLDDNVLLRSNGVFLFTIKEERDTRPEYLDGVGFPLALVACGVCVGVSVVVAVLLIRRYLKKTSKTKGSQKEAQFGSEGHQGKSINQIFTVEPRVAKQDGIGLPGKPNLNTATEA